jgi:hypothetical protein
VSEASDGELGFREPPDGLLTAPEHRVLAHMDAPGAVAAAVDDLADAGFPSEEIYVLCGPEGAARLDVSGEHHGLRGRTYRILEWLGDERVLRLQSADHLAARGLVVTVPAGEKAKVRAARILADHGGREIVHFHRGTWEPLGA